jgi:Cu/Ag efflux protein CusF
VASRGVAVTVRFTALALVLALASAPASGQETASPSDWLDRLDRHHRHLVSQQGHAHAKGHVQAVDAGPGTITLVAEEMRSPDNTIWMPAMRMVFHVTNRQLLAGLQPGNLIEFEAARLRGAVMIVDLRKLN